MEINSKRIAKIIFIMLILLVIFIPISDVLGVTSSTAADTETAQEFKGFLAWMLKIGTGPLTAAIATLLNIVLIIVFMLLYFIFSPISAGLAFPFPDQVIFNKIGFFDPNFINPTDVGGSPVLILQTLIKNLYYTGFVIAGAVFVVAAMTIGIKLALSTIASEKAHYKQALVTWVTGVFLLFTTHFIMLAIFTVNESFVKIISDATTNIKFTFQWTEAIPLIGNSVTNILNALTGFFGGTEPLGVVPVYGYGGLLIKFASAALGGDLVASIICGILLGQTCAIIVMYLKRLFYSIILGIIAPLIIAADIMKKSL
ncbi:MAG: hypothetical protein PHD15_01200 [Clostridia bacterium]|nr:hypothetical protein [Clostridia bacterium]MDD4386366.1 hypothetical protein [Clostridia bacterium]